MEWFPTTQIGIHAEYGLGASYHISTEMNDHGSLTSLTMIDGKGWSVGGRNTLLGLSVYF